LRILVQSSTYRGAKGSLEWKAKKLREQGHEVDVINIIVRRAPPGRPLYFRIPSYVFNYLQSLRGAFKPCRYDQVIVDTAPPFISAALSARTRILGEKLVLMHMDIFPENAETAGVIGQGPLLFALKRAAHWLVSLGDQHLTLSNKMAETLSKILGPEIPVKVEKPRFGPEEIETILHHENEWRRQNGFDNRFVVMYAGNLGIMYDFKPMLEAAGALSHEQKIAFVFVGTGYRADEIKIAVKNMSNVFLFPPQPNEILDQMLSAADVYVIPLQKNADRVMWPSKLDTLKMLNRPILAVGWKPDDSEIKAVEPNRVI